MSGDEAADYYKYTLNEINHIREFKSSPGDYMKKVSPNKVIKPFKYPPTHKESKLTAIDVYEPSANSYAPIPTKANAKTFKKAGLEQVCALSISLFIKFFSFSDRCALFPTCIYALQTVRCGNLSEPTSLPALVSLPQALHTM